MSYLSRRIEGGTTAGVRFGVGTGNQEFHLEKCMISASRDGGGKVVWNLGDSCGTGM